jgi:hypothetical protein
MTSDEARLVVLVDDVRDFRDGRPCLVARSTEAALQVLADLRDRRIDELWLDYDLGAGATVTPVVDHLERMAALGTPQDVALIIVHTRNVVGGLAVRTRLADAGYRVERSWRLGFWTW